MPKTSSRLFLYADDLAIVYQCSTFEEAEKVLEQDLKIVFNYYKSYRLKLNSSKTVISTFHLKNNREARRILVVRVNNEIVSFDECPKYLGIHLDRSLTFKQHLNKTALKVQTRNNIFSKLAGAR